MQEAPAEPGRRPAQQQQQQFAGVDLRRPKGYAAPASAAAPAEGDPCPRCESRDTKFCYYNNYNTSQPRHFCKGCRRYWTKGGTLRNVPVGGGTRKKPSSSPLSSYAANSDKPKKPYKKKRRVVAPQEPVVASATAAATPVVVAPASDSAKSTTKETTTATTTAATPTTTDPASEITTELVVPAAAEEEDSLAHLLQPDAAVALGLGISDFQAGKGLDLEPDSFEWPAAFDLGSCWGNAGFADPDPAGLFLNLP